jgi:hypothetical protein
MSSMQTDVLASQPLTSTGQMLNQLGANIPRCRVRSLYIVPAGTAGSIVLRDGGASGPIIATINTVASATQPTYILVPGEGLLFRTDIHATVTSIGSVVAFYA